MDKWGNVSKNINNFYKSIRKKCKYPNRKIGSKGHDQANHKKDWLKKSEKKYNHPINQIIANFKKHMTLL